MAKAKQAFKYPVSCNILYRLKKTQSATQNLRIDSSYGTTSKKVTSTLSASKLYPQKFAVLFLSNQIATKTIL